GKRHAAVGLVIGAIAQDDGKHLVRGHLASGNLQSPLRAGVDAGAAQSTGTAQNAGTAEEAGTAELPGVVLTSNVLKPGHHGSANATSYSFLMEVNPTYAVISCGTGNEYGHPHEDTLEKLAEAGVNLYRTDLQGTIVCTVRGGKPDFAPQHDPQAAVWIAPPLPEQIPEE
ncbi:MAG: hypothetical protein IKF45_04865, partial [Lachnospiraceae bacterium]|nr:hypothetical protein [Lachnospiraceae bacterium]